MGKRGRPCALQTDSKARTSAAQRQELELKSKRNKPRDDRAIF